MDVTYFGYIHGNLEELRLWEALMIAIAMGFGAWTFFCAALVASICATARRADQALKQG